MASKVVEALRRPLPAIKESPQGRPCPNCSAPVEVGDRFCPTCGTDLPALAEAAPAQPAAVGFRCEQCGAEVRCPPDSRTALCPFCAAPYVVQFDPARSGRQDPEFVIGFAITPEKAEETYRQWLRRGGLFRPPDLTQTVRAEPLRGIYLPFWSFSMKADSRWSAQIGEYWYRTETYTTTDSQGRTVTQTRQVQETEWWPLGGGHHAYYSFYLVSGSKGLPQHVSEWIEPFQVLALKRYAPGYLAGWLSEECSVAKVVAQKLSEEEFRKREYQAVGAFLPGDTHSGLEVETWFSKVHEDLILLPIYLRSYTYRGKLYRILINGQTGKINGEKPVSLGRIALFILLILVLLGLLYALGLLLGAFAK
ncbi:MAG TPA: zinc ribbon domain-containing protein [Isosphaeraceae bacterium]|nr:zinc ribbon domain-containing protein [Isosphaeraceae bacterium]